MCSKIVKNQSGQASPYMLNSLANPTPLNQNPPRNSFLPVDHFAVPRPNNGNCSFNPGPINGYDSRFPRERISTFPHQDQEQLFHSPPQPQPHPVLPAHHQHTVDATQSPPSMESATAFQNSQPARTVRAITPSGGLHLCHIHHNLNQSFAEYKYVHFHPPPLPLPFIPCHTPHSSFIPYYPTAFNIIHATP